MGLEKAELKRETANEIGNALEDVLEQGRLAQARKSGEADAWGAAAKSLEGLLGLVSRDVDEGKLDLEEAKLAKTWLLRAVNGAKGAAAEHLAAFHVAKGKVEALEVAVGVTKRIFDREATKAEALAQDDGANGRGRARPVGAHPGAGVKARRLAEESTTAPPPPASSATERAPKKASSKKGSAKKKAASKGADAGHA